MLLERDPNMLPSPRLNFEPSALRSSTPRYPEKSDEHFTESESTAPTNHITAPSKNINDVIKANENYVMRESRKDVYETVEQHKHGLSRITVFVKGGTIRKFAETSKGFSWGQNSPRSKKSTYLHNFSNNSTPQFCKHQRICAIEEEKEEETAQTFMSSRVFKDRRGFWEQIGSKGRSRECQKVNSGGPDFSYPNKNVRSSFGQHMCAPIGQDQLTESTNHQTEELERLRTNEFQKQLNFVSKMNAASDKQRMRNDGNLLVVLQEPQFRKSNPYLTEDVYNSHQKLTDNFGNPFCNGSGSNPKLTKDQIKNDHELNRIVEETWVPKFCRSFDQELQFQLETEPLEMNREFDFVLKKNLKKMDSINPFDFEEDEFIAFHRQSELYESLNSKHVNNFVYEDESLLKNDESRFIESESIKEKAAKKLNQAFASPTKSNQSDVYRNKGFFLFSPTANFFGKISENVTIKRVKTTPKTII